MPLGRFAAYFFLLVSVCLVAFPRVVGAPPPPDITRQAGDVSPSCSESLDGGVDCGPPARPLGVSRRRTPPALRSRLEAGESLPLPPSLPAEPWRDHHPLDS